MLRLSMEQVYGQLIFSWLELVKKAHITYSSILLDLVSNCEYRGRHFRWVFLKIWNILE